MFRVFVFEPKSKALNSDRERIREAKIAMRPIILLTLLAVPVLMLLPVGHAVPFAATFSAGSFQGPYTLYGGTGGLANLSGFGTIQGSLTTFVGTYTAHFFTSS